LANFLLPTSGRNVSINSHLLNLFINEWLTSINYSTYVAECAPSFCKYTVTEQTNLSYTITLLLSLYGSLTIILRFIASSVVKIISKMTFHLINCNIELSIFHHDVAVLLQHTTPFLLFADQPMVHCRRLTVWLWHLNLFKSANDRTESGIQKQQIMTRMYLISLMGKIDSHEQHRELPIVE
jgi:hypothetical protein